ncbi:MAG TPA: M14 metallopeptidase family protein [Bryobacteraceae bacterium]|nr:M14 metallopeptidase family protein [Bryobacteraceae bacterium]
MFSTVFHAAAQVTPSTSPAPDVPTPESVLGHRPGDDFYLATYDESRDYFHKLAARSNRIKLITVGKTTRSLDWEIAVISSPENLAHLDRHKELSRQLADGRGLSDEAARALAHEGKAIVHIDGGLHSTEVAGAQQSINLAYKLVSAHNDPEVDAILNNVILMLWPTLNPDGQNQVAAWYRKNVGTTFEVSPLPDLYQEYVGHDNNRDGYMNNMLESQAVTRTELEWDPVIFYCHHQTAPFPTRIFIPPFVEPISSNIHPLMGRWLSVIGTDIAAYLDAHEMPGAVNRVGFDNWYPGFLDYTHIFRNSIAFFTETALYRYATPRFYTVDEFPAGDRALRAGVFYSSPWKGGWWRLGDAVRYMQGASMAVLDTAAKYREELLFNRYQAARDNVARFRKEPPFAYVVPRDQRDLAEAATLIQKLIINGIEVHEAVQPFHANGRDYPPGAWVVLMDQPFSALVKELFEPQQYPDLRDTPSSPPKLPYDVTGWTLPMQMGVQVAPVLEPVAPAQRAALHRIERFAPPEGSIDGTGSVFILSHKPNASFIAVNQILADGGHVSFAEKEIETPQGAETGAIVVTGVDRARIGKIVRENSLLAKAAAAPPKDIIEVKKPRVGLYRAWVPLIDEGWSRWVLENYGFNPVTMRNGDIQAGNLRDRFDAIILPDASPETLRNGFGPGTIRGEYTGGIGLMGVAALRDFIQTGGILVTFNNASLLAIDDLGLPVKNVLGGLKDEQFYCSGSLLRVEMQEPGDAAAWGLPHDPVVMFERGPAFESKEGFRGRIIAAYPKEQSPLMSGYLLHPEKIQGKAAAMEVQYGKGRVYLFGFRPQWRGQSHGTYQFIFNAIYETQGLSKPAPIPAPPAKPPAPPATSPEQANQPKVPVE